MFGKQKIFKVDVGGMEQNHEKVKQQEDNSNKPLLLDTYEK